MNKKISITLLNLFFVCTSNVIYSGKTSSLQVCAAKAAVGILDQRVQTDVAKLKKDGQLTANNVLAAIDDNIAQFHASREAIGALVNAYRKLHTTFNSRGESSYQQDIPVSDGYFQEGAVKFNGHHDLLAFVMSEKAFRGPSVLDVYTESRTGWKKESLGVSQEQIHGVLWRDNDQFILLTRSAIAMVQTPDRKGYEERVTVPYQSGGNCYHAWSEKEQTFAIERETERGEDAAVDIFEFRDNAWRKTQSITCPSEVRGIRLFDRWESLLIFCVENNYLATYKKQSGRWVCKKEENQDDSFLYLDRGKTRADAPCFNCDDVFGASYWEHNTLSISRKLVPLYDIAKQLAGAQTSESEDDDE